MTITSVTIRLATEKEVTDLKDPAGLIEKACNTWKVLTTDNFSGVLNSCMTDSFASRFSIIKMRTWIITSDPQFMKSIFNLPRDDPDENGFMGGSSSITHIIGPLFPGVDLRKEDSILHCPIQQNKIYRKLIEAPLSYKATCDHADTISKLIKDEVEQWKDTVSLNKLPLLVSSIVSKVLLGYDGPYKELCDTITLFNEVLLRNYFGKKPEDQNAYEKAVKYLHSFLDSILDKETDAPFVKALQESEDITRLQKQLLIAFSYFASQENTTAVLTNTLWQLALHPSEQDKIYQDIQNNDVTDLNKKIGLYETIQKAFIAGIKGLTPGYSLARLAKNDLVATATYSDGSTRQKLIEKNQQMNPCPGLYQEPRLQNGQYNLDDFSATEKLDHLPFGGGPHICPGRYLAKVIIRLAVEEIVKNFTFTTDVKESEKVGMTSLKLKEEITLNLTRRKR